MVRFSKRGSAACGKCVGNVTVAFVLSALVPRGERDGLFQVWKVVKKKKKEKKIQTIVVLFVLVSTLLAAINDTPCFI